MKYGKPATPQKSSLRFKRGFAQNSDITQKTEEEMFRLLGTFADLTYYTAVSHDRDAYIMSFSTIMDGKVLRYCYLGSEVLSTQEIVDKIFKKIEYSKQKKEKAGLSCFGIHQILN